MGDEVLKGCEVKGVPLKKKKVQEIVEHICMLMGTILWRRIN